MHSELSIKLEKWFKSEEGAKCTDSNFIYGFHPEQYLKHRLELAFIAGAAATQEVQDEICQKLLSEGKAK